MYNSLYFTKFLFRVCSDFWCCSEHYLWLFDGDLYLDPSAAVYCSCAVVSEDAKTTLASGPQTLSLEGGSYLVSRCVRLWIKLTSEYPFKMWWEKKTLNRHANVIW